jgi:hypothetical protein
MVFILTAAGIYLTTLTEKFLKKTDPALVVIDEWVGQWITLLPLIYSGRDDLFLFVLGLIFFRLFDIKKPFGIYQLQSLPGGWGMMAAHRGHSRQTKSTHRTNRQNCAMLRQTSVRRAAEPNQSVPYARLLRDV